jgi:hypothetical protein
MREKKERTEEISGNKIKSWGTSARELLFARYVIRVKQATRKFNLASSIEVISKHQDGWLVVLACPLSRFPEGNQGQTHSNQTDTPTQAWPTGRMRSAQARVSVWCTAS